MNKNIECKNCDLYQCTLCDTCENSKELYKCSCCYNCYELSYCNDCTNCFNSAMLDNCNDCYACEECSSCILCTNCEYCSDCYECNNLKGTVDVTAQYFVNNEFYGKDKYILFLNNLGEKNK